MFRPIFTESCVNNSVAALGVHYAAIIYGSDKAFYNYKSYNENYDFSL